MQAAKEEETPTVEEAPEDSEPEDDPKPETPEEPVSIKPGDRIEFPDYLLEVRDSREPVLIDATVNVEVVSNSVIIIRRVASELGVPRWTTSAIHDWLGAVAGREIWVRHEHVELCLPGRIALEQLERRLELFDALVAHLDPRSLVIDLQDPAAAP